MKEMLGLAPAFFDEMSCDVIEPEWELMKVFDLGDEPVPRKERELIGLGLMSAQKCRYCTLFHSEFAKAYGSTDEELEFATHFAKSVAGWTGYFYGLQIDAETIRKEMAQLAQKMKGPQKPVVSGPLKDVPREMVYDEMKNILGFVPLCFEKMSHSTLNIEWHLIKQLWFADGPISQKYRHLMGLAIASAQKATHSVVVHTGLARGFGATDEEIEFIVHYTKSDVGWSAYLYGKQVDFDKFRNEIRQICDRIRAAAAEIA